MQFNTTYNTYEPLLEVASYEPQYYDPLNDCYPPLYIDPNLSHYFSYSPQASVDEQIPMAHRDSIHSHISTPPVYYSVSPLMAYLSPPYIAAASPQSEHVSSPQSDYSYVASDYSDCEPKSQENCGGGKKRITKSTRAKRNQVLCEHTGGNKKKNNKQHEDDDEKQFKCTIEDCGKVFKRAEHLKRHVKSIHDRIKDFECNFPGCDRAFSRSDNLNQHLRTHRSESIKKKRAAN